jgi:hypothetical protein
MSVWVLVFFFSIVGFGYPGATVIDNIATLQECERVMSALSGPHNWRSMFEARCSEVRKAK